MLVAENHHLIGWLLQASRGGACCSVSMIILHHMGDARLKPR